MSLENKADSLQIMTATLDTPETNRRGSHVKKKEQINLGQVAAIPVPRTGQRIQLAIL